MKKGRPSLKLLGKSFGVLTVEKRVRRGGRGAWKCVCKCGGVVYRDSSALKRSSTCCGRQCPFRKQTGRVKHGMFGTPEYSAWIEMRRRCYDPSRREYKDYGGRGIKVCASWLDPKSGFERFMADMGQKPSPDHTLGRVNNDKMYAPWNCEWQTVATQNDNKSTTVRLTYAGRTLSLRQWSKLLGVPRSRLYQRYRKRKPVAEILAEYAPTDFEDLSDDR